MDHRNLIFMKGTARELFAETGNSGKVAFQQAFDLLIYKAVHIFTSMLPFTEVKQVSDKLTAKRDELAAEHKMSLARLNLIQDARVINFKSVLENCDYEELGCGEKGTCYRCKFKTDHELAGFEVVVKCPLRETSGKDIFLHEVAVLANLWCIGHPNFVSPVIYNNHNGRTCMLIVSHQLEIYPVMEVVEGFPLREIFDTPVSLESWSVFDRIWMFVQLTDSLRFVHAYGYPHWDLHFGNIMVRDKVPIIIDLGSMANTDVPKGLRADDLKSLWKVLKVMLGGVEGLPQPFCDWMKNIDDNELLPKTISDLCTALGPMSAMLCAIKSNGFIDNVTVDERVGYVYISLENTHHRNLCRKTFERTRKEQQEAIKRALNGTQEPSDENSNLARLALSDLNITINY